MAELNIHELIELVNNNHIEQAAQLLNNFVDDAATQDRGQVLVDLVGLYLDVQAANQDELLTLLDEQINKLKELDKMERTSLEEIDLQQARNSLK